MLNIFPDFLKNVVSLGAGEPLVNEYLSTINYHSEQPKWGETVKVKFNPLLYCTL